MANGTSSFNGVAVSVTGEPSVSNLDAVRAGLVAYNEGVAGADKAAPIGVFATRDGVVIGGATGFTQWEWLFIEYLWVSDEVRGKGLGAHLLQKVEAAARERGCGAVWLDTFSFQAPEFYERFGYRHFGQLDDYPPGRARHFLWKPLANDTVGPSSSGRGVTLLAPMKIWRRLRARRR
jgi:GNAT superfamily N-acetyltransferase